MGGREIARLDGGARTQCIGVAESSSPLGPFWKSDDNGQVDGTTHSSIYAQRLAAAGWWTV